MTLLATTEQDGTTALPPIDGSTWDPWARRLLFTSEALTTGGVWQATTDVPSTVVNLQGIIGIGGYEGIQNDSAGNLWIVEDVGGKSGATNNFAKQPNSFVYRFKPYDPTDLTKGGKLQVLQVGSLQTPGQPIAFNGTASGSPTAAQADADILSADTKDLHTYGHTFATKFVTIHDTADRRDRAVQRERRREGREGHAVQAAGERAVPAGQRASGRSSSTRRATPTTARRPRRTSAASAESSGCDLNWPGLGHRQAAALLQGRSGAHRPRQRDVPVEDEDRVRRGRGRHAAHAAQRARLGVAVRHGVDYSGARRSGAGAVHRRGP